MESRAGAGEPSTLYQKCVREHGPLDCEVHKAQMRIANQRVEEARDTLRLAKASEKQACR